MADREFTNVNGIKVCDQTARDNIPTKTSQLTNDSGYITNIPDEYITEAELKAKKYTTEQYVDDTVHNAIIRNEYTHPSTHPASMITGLSTVATSGSYDDLTDKPIIPTRTSELANNSDFVDSAFVSQKIAEASLSGGEVDLSGYVTKETGNASQITFADGQTFQAKLDAGTLKGEQGIQGIQGLKGDKGDTGQDGLTTTISVNGTTYTHSNGTITLPNYPTVVSTANGITIADTAGNFTATNVEGALAELFQFVSNGKSLIASAITDMGISTSNTDTFQVMANNIRMISGSSGEITTHTITNNLTNCTTNNNNESVLSNSSYSAIITANNGYTNLSITVTMGEIDITSNVVRGNIINIPNVTGNISITARATQSSTEVVIDESLEILTSFNYINMTEGGYKVLYVKLSKQPTSNVVVNISSSSSNLSLSKSSLTFTNTNWYTSQSVNVISSSDTNTIDEMYQLTLSSSGLSDKIVTIDVTDESNSGFEVLYNNGELISGASLSLNNATDNGTYITTNMNADESIIISGYKLNLNKNDKVHLLVGLATTDPSGIYSIRSMQLGDSSANDISGSNMISEEAISKNLVNGKVDTYWTVASSLSNIELTFTGYFARVNIYKIYIERGN